MKKTFCDVCNCEMQPVPPVSFQTDSTKVYVNGIEFSAPVDLCFNCIVDGFNKADPRNTPENVEASKPTSTEPTQLELDFGNP